MLIKNVILFHTPPLYLKIYGYRLHATRLTNSLVAITKICTHYIQLRVDVPSRCLILIRSRGWQIAALFKKRRTSLI
jgi:hypothetical protein